MKILKIAGGRKFKFYIVGGPNGEKKLHWFPNQGLGKSCKDAANVLNPGVAIDEQMWDDEPPEDVRYEEQAVQIRQ